MNGNLHPVQFGGVSGGSGVEKAHPPHASDSSAPLALGSQTFGSVNTAAAWRKPNQVLPYSAATAGSVFKPF